MKLIELFRRRQEESLQKRKFIEDCLKRGFSFNKAESLYKAKVKELERPACPSHTY